MAKAKDDQPLTQALISTIYHCLREYPALFVFAFFVFRFLYKRYSSPLRRYPGPFLASGTRLWNFWTTWNGQAHLDHINLHKRYGPIVRIAPNELSFSSPEAAREILSPGKGFHKTKFYSVFPPKSNPDIFTEIREDVHARKKRIAVTPYSLSSIQAMTQWIEATQDTLISKIDGFVEAGQVIDLGSWLHYFAFDVLGEIAFSTTFGFLQQGKDVEGMIQMIDQVQTYDGVVGQAPILDAFLRNNPLKPYIPFIGNQLPLITRIALGELDKRKQGTVTVDRRDLLTQLLEANEKDSGRLSEGDVFAIAHGAIFAGSDSTASTMQSFFCHVLSNHAIYDRLTKEVLAVNAQGDLSDNVAYEEALKYLPYFQACLKEAMRLQPAVGLNITRNVPTSGAEISGTWIPGGTQVAVNAWVTHRDREIFGQDTDSFKPERWLVNRGKSASNTDKANEVQEEEEEKRIKRMDRYMFQFGGGSHLCIGRNLALYEMNKVLPQLLRRYKFELTHPSRPMHGHSSFFYVQEGLEVKVSLRDGIKKS